MFNNAFTNEMCYGHETNPMDTAPLKSAQALFRRARRGGWMGRLWGALTGRACRLFSLEEVERQCRVRGRHYAGTCSVPLNRIKGSEGRETDFDAAFNPRCEHNRERWVSVATAWLMGETLPPVELIQVGDLYFVRDGHHRISVAKALGQWSIDAEVTVWQVNGPLPWEKGAGYVAAHQTA